MPRQRLYAVLATSLVAAAGLPAQAETSPYYIGISQAVSYDDNLLRLPDGVAVPAGFARSDSIAATSLLAGFDQPLGRHRLFANGALRDNRFRNNTLYDNQAYTASGGLDWSTVERISGDLRFNANRNLVTFSADDELGQQNKKNVETTRQLSGAVRVGVTTTYTAELGLDTRSARYSAPEFFSRNMHQNQTSLGLRFRPGGAGSLGISVRQAHGTYPNYEQLADGSSVADGYSRQDLDLTAQYIGSGASLLDMRISRSRSRYDQATQRDFDGYTGQIHGVWAPTGKLKLDAVLVRDSSQDAYFFADSARTKALDYSRITNSWRLRLDYEASAKISLNVSAGSSRRDLAQTRPLFTNFNLDATGQDRTDNYGLGLTWQPVRSLSLGCDLGRERRGSDGALSSSYRASTASCYGQWLLQ